MTASIYAIVVAAGVTALLSYLLLEPRRTGPRGAAAKLEALEAENDHLQLAIDSLRAELSEATNAFAMRAGRQEKILAEAQSRLELIGSALAASKSELAQNFASQEERFIGSLQEIDALLRSFVTRANQRASDIVDLTPLVRAMLMDWLEDAVLYPHSGESVAGERLVRVIEDALTVAATSRTLSDTIPPRLLEHAAISGVLNPMLLLTRDQAADAARYVAHRLNKATASPEPEWTGDASADGLTFSRGSGGKPESHILDRALIESPEAEALDRMAGDLQAIYLESARLVWKGRSFDVRAPSELLNALFWRNGSSDRADGNSPAYRIAGVAA